MDRRDSAETDEGCSSGVRRWHSLEHPSSVAFGDTFSHKGRRKVVAIAEKPKHCYLAAMEKLFSDPAYKGFVLQDRKRLPSRFAARVCGAPTSRLS
ncbi:hypothetical protein RFM98_12610 [Mesorhizobium sp. VK9D]|uniref:hypothetical protein n=1 Tax=Mesorhizobium australafricanum TaxID=3072311 RepID=UPI002A24880D|nr:hypothetical protein [Mesorhizobium sp. VK9D]MDX8453601.1 hypothetical protein [Mesorhizobium sp. VK9D]